MSRTRFTRRPALGLAAIAAPLVLVACSGGAQLSQGETQTPSAVTPTASGTGPARATPATPGPAATTSAAPARSAATTAAAPAPCRSSALRVTSRDAGGAAGSVLVDLVLTNTSSVTCTVTGYPGVSWVAGADGHQVGSAATRSGEPASTVVLAAGRATTSQARFARAANYPASRCAPVPARGFRVYPPAQTQSYFVPYPATACSSTQVNQLEVRPFGVR